MKKRNYIFPQTEQLRVAPDNVMIRISGWDDTDSRRSPRNGGPIDDSVDDIGLHDDLIGRRSEYLWDDAR